MNCPYCAETIADQAIKCRHCGSDLNLVKSLQERISSLESALAGAQSPQFEPPAAASLTASTTTPLVGKWLIIPGAIACAGLYLIGFNFVDDIPIALAFLLMLLAPLGFGFLLGWGIPGRHMGLYLGAGVGVGVLFNLGGVLLEGADNFSAHDLVGPLGGMVVANFVLVPLGALLGDWIERRKNRPEIRPDYARDFARSLLGRNAPSRAGYLGRVDHLAKLISAIAPLLTFLATVIAAWLTFLGTRATAGK